MEVFQCYMDLCLSLTIQFDLHTCYSHPLLFLQLWGYQDVTDKIKKGVTLFIKLKDL